MGELVSFLIGQMNAAPPELISLLMLISAYGGVLVLMRKFGAHGLVAFVVIALVAANIQVLKVVQFTVLPQPVALGTVLFSSTYLAMDLLAEYYGAALARKTIWIGFFCLLFYNLFMLLTLGYRPLTAQAATGMVPTAAETENALKLLVQPQLGLLLAGLISYLVSQHLDVFLYTKVKRSTHGKRLWLRNGIATIISALVDNTVFSILAWEVFAATPVPLNQLIFTYILGTFLARVLVALLDTPFMYLSRQIVRRPAPGVTSGTTD